MLYSTFLFPTASVNVGDLHVCKHGLTESQLYDGPGVAGAVLQTASLLID